MRAYTQFSYKGTNFRISCNRLRAVTDEIVAQRKNLEEYIAKHPEFEVALVPIAIAPDAPVIVQRMAEASKMVGVGPMAAVAGAVAQIAAEAGLRQGASEAIIDNGGDIFICASEPVLVGIFVGNNKLGHSLAMRILPQSTPIAVCSSSGIMGRSFSFGLADLACVVSPDAAIADAAATLACNLVRSPQDIQRALERISSIKGVQGLLIVKDDKIGLIGRLPELIKHREKIPQGLITGL